MLYDKDLVVPDKASAVQLEKRVKAKVANPFNMKKLREAAKEQAKVEPPAQIWNPQIQVGKRITPAAPAVKPPPSSNLFSPSYTALMHPFQQEPATPAADTAPEVRLPEPGASAIDEFMQRPVDPGLLTSSRGRASKRRANTPPTDRRRKVRCKFAVSTVLRLLTPHLLCAADVCVAAAPPGVGSRTATCYTQPSFLLPAKPSHVCQTGEKGII